MSFQLDGEGNGILKAKAFRMTDKIDEKGYFVLEKHCFVTLHFEEVTEVNLRGFMPGQAILYAPDIEKAGQEFIVSVNSSYGFDGVLKMKGLRIELEPAVD